jgi:phosphoribosylanthranilate isomerase
MWVKLCANTSLSDARMCAGAGADAVGFVFARGSKRMVTAAEVALISRAIAEEFPAIERVGVFTEGSAASIAAGVVECDLTAVQLQGDVAQRETDALRDLLPGVEIIAAFGWAGDADFVRKLDGGSHDRLMVDSGDSKAVGGSRMLGGTGTIFDWQQARRSFLTANAKGFRVIAAGGLTPENVTEAVTILQPWGVDVASGVESAPGIKDPAKVARFVAAARGARPA